MAVTHQDKKVDISVLDFPLLNTKNTSDTITGKLISDLVLQVLSYVSQMEREQIKQRQLEGIIEAKKKGQTIRKTEDKYSRKIL